MSGETFRVVPPKWPPPGELAIAAGIFVVAWYLAGWIAVGVVVVLGVIIRLIPTKTVVLNGPCPVCGVVAERSFENPADPTSSPTPCKSCVAYLRESGDTMREESSETASRFGFPYQLSADQYLPAVTRTNHNSYKFQMPAMCAVCGEPPTQKRLIDDNDHFGRDIGILWSQKGHVLPQAGMAPSAPTEDDKNSAGLSRIHAPVCAKHTEAEDPSCSVLRYSSGSLQFASYRFYKAFCELNKIDRAAKKPG